SRSCTICSRPLTSRSSRGTPHPSTASCASHRTRRPVGGSWSSAASPEIPPCAPPTNNGNHDGVTDLSASFPDLTFDRPAPRMLRITLDGPGLNSVNHAVHRQLADVWRAVDEDAETNAVVLRGAGKAFSAGG